MRRGGPRCPTCGARGPVWQKTTGGGAIFMCGNAACGAASGKGRRAFTNAAPWPFGARPEIKPVAKPADPPPAPLAAEG